MITINEQEYLRLCAIRDGAPEGATHYASKMHYMARNSKGRWMRHDKNGLNGFCWFEADDYKLEWFEDFRSLFDIKTQIAMYEENQRLQQELMEKTKRLHELANGTIVQGSLDNIDVVLFQKLLYQRDLEQQAKGVEDCMVELAKSYQEGETLTAWEIGANCTIAKMAKYAHQLRQQAKEL